MSPQPDLAPARLRTPLDLEVLEFQSYALVIDARSQHEYTEDHLPTAINLPVVDDAEYAEVGTQHRHDTHGAYLVGVEYALMNIARQIRPLIANYQPADRMLVYCFRGGKRSKLWADNLRTIGFEVDVLKGGWKAYRRWVRAGLESLPPVLEYRVLTGSTGSGKTRLLHALQNIGEQVLDLESLASHRGSLIGAVPGQAQPSQKFFDTLLFDALRRFDPARPIWIEAESKKIGNVQLPTALHDAMHRAAPIKISAPMRERVRLWREDYPNLVSDPVGMVKLLEPLKPMIGGDELSYWRSLANDGVVDMLFERVMEKHYDPCYRTSTGRAYKQLPVALHVELESLEPAALQAAAQKLVEQHQS